MLANKRVGTFVLFGWCLILLIVAIGLWLIIDRFADEDRDYKLSSEMHKLAKELKDYKQKNGKYPENIKAIRSTDELCVDHFYTKCKKVYYKPSIDFQDFRMASYSFSWPILYYNPAISMTVEEWGKKSAIEQKDLVNKHGSMCVFCVVSESGYRSGGPIFANPDDWPEL